MSFHHPRFDPFDPFFDFPLLPSSCHLSSSSYHHRELALGSPPPFPFPFAPPHSSHAFDHFSYDLDLFTPPHHFDRLPLSACPYYNSSALDLFDLSDRFSHLELGARRHCPAFRREVKHTWKTEIKGDRKYKWVAESKPNGEKKYLYEAEIESPWEDGFDRKFKWTAGTDGKAKWTKEIKGKGCHEAWAHKYTCEDSLNGDWWKKYHKNGGHELCEELPHGDWGKKCHKKEGHDHWAHKYYCDDSPYGDGWSKCYKKDKGHKEEKKDEKKEKKEKHSVKVVEIEDSTSACDAIRKVQTFRVFNSLFWCL